jgi:hypothetical protein
MLDVHCGPHFDAAIQQGLNVFPSFASLGTGNVRVCQFIYEGNLGVSAQYSVSIHFVERLPSVFDFAVWNCRELLELRYGVGPRVRFKICYTDVDTALGGGPRVGQHLKCLTDACRVSKIDF